MRTPGIPIFLTLALGTLAALYLPAGMLPWLAASAVAAWQLALLAFVMSRMLLFVVAVLASIALSAAASASHIDWQRRNVSLLAFAPAAGTPSPRAEPIVLEGVLLEDGSMRADGGGALQMRVDRALWRTGIAHVEGGVALSVAGAPHPDVVREWTRGRRIRAPATLRRPARYLNDGVPDGELASMRRGIALVGSVKSAALVELLRPGSWLDEVMARTRARVRAAVLEAAGADAVAAAVVTAILIGDRAGLADDIERRMQRAGTYHVIAISGGNIALFAMLAWALCRVVLRSRRMALCGAILIVTAYGLLVGTGASVGRAVCAALLFMCAALVDHRASPLNVIAIVGAGFLVWDPLALVDLGFLLSFGATAGILLAVPAWMPRLKQTVGWPRRHHHAVRLAIAAVAMIAASAAAEIALLPIQATAFHRLTIAGLLLNLIAIPAMAMTQIAGMAIVACVALQASLATGVAATVAQLAARTLVDSAALVDKVPALTWRVAAPPDWLIGLYVVAVALLAWRRCRRARRVLVGVATATAAAIALSLTERRPSDGRLRLSLLDVGQAEAILLKLPSGRNLLVDAAGPSGRFDIGDRIVVPSLLARGVTRLDWFVLTHADVDHAGGALSVITDFRPSRVLEAIAPPLHVERNRIARAALATGASIETLRAGVALMLDGVLLRVLHPPEPDWERQDVRNDDSLVIDVRFGSVSILLTGDAGEAVEAGIAERAGAAPLRILKVGHHGSRTSTSQALLDAVRPSAALISVGRHNFYGHPSPVVVGRLRRAGIETFRTDHDGQIDVTTDGRTIEISTWSGRRWAVSARR